MLRIRMLSGDEVTSIPVEEVGSVRDVKQRLHRLHGFPPRFRQRLILQGSNLDDAEILDSPRDLELLVLPVVSQTQAGDLADAARDGSVEKAGDFATRQAKTVLREHAESGNPRDPNPNPKP